eukprot:365048-Chlamydomonas_euryale.AAC.29
MHSSIAARFLSDKGIKPSIPGAHATDGSAKTVIPRPRSHAPIRFMASAAGVLLIFFTMSTTDGLSRSHVRSPRRRRGRRAGSLYLMRPPLQSTTGKYQGLRFVPCCVCFFISLVNCIIKAVVDGLALHAMKYWSGINHQHTALNIVIQRCKHALQAPSMCLIMHCVRERSQGTEVALIALFHGQLNGRV